MLSKPGVAGESATLLTSPEDLVSTRKMLPSTGLATKETLLSPSWPQLSVAQMR